MSCEQGFYLRTKTVTQCSIWLQNLTV